MPKSKKPVISFSNVSKVFSLQREKKIKFDFFNPFKKGEERKISVLDNVSFSIYPGETVGLVGPNGAGKTTLLRLAAGILQPTTGTVKIQGKVAPLIELGAGFHSEFSGRENVYLNGVILGMSFKEISALFPSILDFAGNTVRSYIEEPLKHYSMGMKARLGFSIAIHTDPDILLIDESLSVGDENFRQKSIKKIRELQKKGKTIIMTSHNPELISLVCKRVITLENGKLI